MARVGIVAFYQMCARFADDMLCGWYYLGVNGPLIGVIGASGASDAFPESAKGDMITATHHPGNTTPFATIIGFPNPTNEVLPHLLQESSMAYPLDDFRRQYDINLSKINTPLIFLLISLACKIPPLVKNGVLKKPELFSELPSLRPPQGEIHYR
jgi:hypothetical protein